MFTVNMGPNEPKIFTKECNLEGRGGHLGASEACWVLIGLQDAPRDVHGQHGST